MTDGQWNEYRAYQKAEYRNLEETVALLRSAAQETAAGGHTAGAKTQTVAATSQSVGAPGSNGGSGTDDPDSLGNKLERKAVDTATDCVKLKAAYYACDKFPFPLNSGCHALAKAQFDNIACKLIDLREVPALPIVQGPCGNAKPDSATPPSLLSARHFPEAWVEVA